MEENKKNRFGMGVLFGVLIALVIVLAGFIICDKFLFENNNGNNKEVSNNIKENNNINSDIINNNSSSASDKDKHYEISIDSQLVKNLWDISGSEWPLLNGDDDKMIEIFYKNDTTVINNLSVEAKARLLERQLEKIGAENNNACYDDYGCDFKYWGTNLVANTYNLIFGNDNYIKDKIIGCSHYQKDYSLYHSKNCGDSVGIVGATSTLVKATQSTDEIVLYQFVRFSSQDVNGTISYYKDYNKINATTEAGEKTANYKRVFKKNNLGNYYFYSIEKIN